MDDRARGQREAEDGPRVVFGGEDTTQGGGEALDWTGRGALIGTPQTITRARVDPRRTCIRCCYASARGIRATAASHTRRERRGADDGRRRSLD
jgi:hypothetical protein